MVSTRSIVRVLIGLFITAIFGLGLVLSAAFIYLSPQLPSPESLRNIELKTPLRVYTKDHKLIGEFGAERRIPLTYEQIPPLFTKALLAAEDDNFYHHHGVDVKSLLRAASQLVMTGHIKSGGSTITMQVAKNYFLTHKRTFSRKFREILLALQIERELSKEEILELYINKIFLGHRAYGIAAAAQVYYGKPIDEISIAQLAMIAGLPKAPSAYNPLANPSRALTRRNWILGRMQSLGYIDNEQYQQAHDAPITAKYHGSRVQFNSPYIAEMARREMIKLHGKDAYTKGFKVFTTVNSKLQFKAQQALVNGLKAYDSRHGYRGPESHIKITDMKTSIAALASYRDVSGMKAALVTSVKGSKATLLLKDQSEHVIQWDNRYSSLRPYINVDARGPKPKRLSDIISTGDIIRVERNNTDTSYLITQRPNVEGGIVALSPHNGAIQALVGGFDFRQSNFNRIIQAKRQPGSNFKPFIYSAAFAAGYTPATVINDAPVVFEGTKSTNAWRPVNSSGNFYGPTRLRKALYTSRNLVSIRIFRKAGISKSIKYMGRFGFDSKKMPRNLSLALGSYALTPMSLVTGYTAFANGGYGVKPYLIDHIENSYGKVLFTADPATVCKSCSDDPGTAADDNAVASTTEANVDNAETTALDEQNKVSNPAKLIMDTRIAYQIDSILKEVITHGTGRRALALKRNDIAGKTGTTNGPTDAWFSGYNEDIVTTTWVGFDRYNKLGKHEYGGSAALPIWMDFMKTALKDKPIRARKQPPGLVTVRIDPASGQLAYSNQRNAIFETFRKEKVPGRRVRAAAPRSKTSSSNRSSTPSRYVSPQEVEKASNIEDELF